MAEPDMKKLSELRVVDLKLELEKRELDIAGVKAVLVKKLHKAMVDEGLDPDTHLFSVDFKVTPKKVQKKESDDSKVVEDPLKDDSKEAEVEKKENTVVENLVPEEKESKEATESKETTESKEATESTEDVIVEKETIDSEPKVEKPKMLLDFDKMEDKDDEINYEEDEEKPIKEETDEEGEVRTLEKEDDDDNKLDEKNDVNGIDTEDSIHLTIGEDEEKLMAGEVEDVVVKRKSVKQRLGKKIDLSSNKDGRQSSPEKSDDKGKKINHRNLWVSGLSSTTRATDLKHVFSKVGKVIAAKVVTNAKTPGARCYGFVTMATPEDAQGCIKELNLTELHGRLISVETVANKPKNPGTRKEDLVRKSEESTKPPEEKRRKKDSDGTVPPGTEGQNGDNVAIEEKAESVEAGRTSSVRDITIARSSSRSRRSVERRRSPPERRRSRDKHHRTSGSTRSEHGVLSFTQIKEERERQRLREKERALREEDRRRREERERHRVIERKQRDEAARLEREREKIRLEMARLEKERAELLRLERERLQREKEDLKRQQLKLEEERRSKRTLSSSRDPYDDRKRPSVEVRSSRDYKEKSSRRVEGLSPPPRSRYDDVSPAPSSRSSRREEPRIKEIRYPDRATPSSSSFRSREDRERREEEKHRKTESSRSSHRDRYEISTKSGEHRYGVESWTSSSGSTSKGGGFGSSVVPSGREPPPPSWTSISSDRKAPDMGPWTRAPGQSDRWVSGSGSTLVSGSSSSSRSIYPPIGTSLSATNPMAIGGGPIYPQSGDRFDAYKSMTSMSRKY